MKNIMKMKRERQAVYASLRALVDAADKETRGLTVEEDAKYVELKSDLDRRDAEIQREEELAEYEKRTAIPSEEENSQEFREFGEFIQEVAFNRGASSRLKMRDLGEARTTTMANDVSAGYLVPTQFETTIRQVNPQEAIFRPRAQIIAAPQGSPDARIELLSLDQSGALGVYSGVKVNWVASETDARISAGDAKFRRIPTEPHEVSGYITVSDKMLRNSAAIGPYVQRLLRQAIISAEEHAFLTGDGSGKPTGLIGHTSSIVVERETDGTVTYNDIANMYSAMMTGRGVWIANRTVLPKLMHLKDAAGNMIWQPNAREGEPSTLIGSPVLFNERSPALNTEGDLIYVDLDYYVIRDGSPLAIKIDPYTGMNTQVVNIYAFWNVDGVPQLKTPLVQEDGATQVSPFVVLGAA